MIQNHSILTIIPARGGSKGLPGKNILPLLGKPLIGWTIESAQKSKYIDKIIVSTEDEAIKKVAENFNIEVPFIRPKELATDDAIMYEVILNSMDWADSQNVKYSIVLLLQVTSPLRSYLDIDMAIELLIQRKAMAIVSVSEMEHSPLWSNTLPESRCMKNFLRPEYDKNRQHLPTYYRLNGAIYLAYKNYLINKKSFFGENTYAYIMPKNRSIDIDNEIDFKLVEILLKNKLRKI